MIMKFRKMNYLFFPVSILLFTVSSSAAQPSHAVVPYHGMRMTSKHSDFYVIKIEAKKTESENLLVDVYFNSAVDPRTVSTADILVNGQLVPYGTVELFNKAGTEIRLEFPETACKTILSSADAKIRLEFISAASFNGSPLLVNMFDGITGGYVQVFKKPEETGIN
jgi:hypothetical protein